MPPRVACIEEPHELPARELHRITILRLAVIDTQGTEGEGNFISLRRDLLLLERLIEYRPLVAWTLRRSNMNTHGTPRYIAATEMHRGRRVGVLGMGACHRLRTDASACTVSPGRMNCPASICLHGAHVHLSDTYDCDPTILVKVIGFTDRSIL